MEIKSIDDYRSKDAKLLAKFGNDKNGNSEIDVSEADDSLTVGKFKEVAKAGDDHPNTISYLDVLAYEGYQISKEVLAKVNPILEIAEMVDIPGQPGIAIMKDEVTVGLFKRVMEGYEITGHNADELKGILADPSKQNDPLTYVNIYDAREFAKRLSDLTGRRFRVQFEDEWLSARVLLSGNNVTWTETKFSNDYYVLRHVPGLNGGADLPERRFSNYAVRLVEDK